VTRELHQRTGRAGLRVRRPARSSNKKYRQRCSTAWRQPWRPENRWGLRRPPVFHLIYQGRTCSYDDGGIGARPPDLRQFSQLRW